MYPYPNSNITTITNKTADGGIYLTPQDLYFGTTRATCTKCHLAKVLEDPMTKHLKCDNCEEPQHQSVKCMAPDCSLHVSTACFHKPLESIDFYLDGLFCSPACGNKQVTFNVVRAFNHESAVPFAVREGLSFPLRNTIEDVFAVLMSRFPFTPLPKLVPSSDTERNINKQTGWLNMSTSLAQLPRDNNNTLEISFYSLNEAMAGPHDLLFGSDDSIARGITRPRSEEEDVLEVPEHEHSSGYEYEATKKKVKPMQTIEPCFIVAEEAENEVAESPDLFFGPEDSDDVFFENFKKNDILLGITGPISDEEDVLEVSKHEHSSGDEYEVNPMQTSEPREEAENEAMAGPRDFLFGSDDSIARGTTRPRSGEEDVLEVSEHEHSSGDEYEVNPMQTSEPREEAMAGPRDFLFGSDDSIARGTTRPRSGEEDVSEVSEHEHSSEEEYEATKKKVKPTQTRNRIKWKKAAIDSMIRNWGLDKTQSNVVSSFIHAKTGKCKRCYDIRSKVNGKYLVMVYFSQFERGHLKKILLHDYDIIKWTTTIAPVMIGQHPKIYLTAVEFDTYFDVKEFRESINNTASTGNWAAVCELYTSHIVAKKQLPALPPIESVSEALELPPIESVFEALATTGNIEAENLSSNDGFNFNLEIL